MQNYNAKPSVINSFEASSGIKLADILNAKEIKHQRAEFKTRTVTEEINKKLIALQGVQDKKIRLYNSKENAPASAKEIWLFIVINDATIKSYFKCRYTVETEKTVDAAKEIRPDGTKVYNPGVRKATKKAPEEFAPLDLIVKGEAVAVSMPVIAETVSITVEEYNRLIAASQAHEKSSSLFGRKKNKK